VFTYSVQLSGSTPLLRQYFPKGTDLSVYSQEDLDYVAWKMNDRPRKRLDYLKPNEMIEPLLLR
jgi:IS30 family transposase